MTRLIAVGIALLIAATALPALAAEPADNAIKGALYDIERAEEEVGRLTPSRAANIWVSDMLRLFRPQIEELLHRRDAAVDHWQLDHPDVDDVLEDRNLEVAAICDIAVDEQILAVEDALQALG